MGLERNGWECWEARTWNASLIRGGSTRIEEILSQRKSSRRWDTGFHKRHQQKRMQKQKVLLQASKMSVKIINHISLHFRWGITFCPSLARLRTIQGKTMKSKGWPLKDKLYCALVLTVILNLVLNLPWVLIVDMRPCILKGCCFRFLVSLCTTDCWNPTIDGSLRYSVFVKITKIITKHGSRIFHEEMTSHMMPINQKEVKSPTSLIWNNFKQFIVVELEYSFTVLLFFYRYLREDLSINRMHQLYLPTHEPKVWNRQQQILW